MKQKIWHFLHFSSMSNREHALKNKQNLICVEVFKVLHWTDITVFFSKLLIIALKSNIYKHIFIKILTNSNIKYFELSVPKLCCASWLGDCTMLYEVLPVQSLSWPGFLLSSVHWLYQQPWRGFELCLLLASGPILFLQLQRPEWLCSGAPVDRGSKQHLI